MSWITVGLWVFFVILCIRYEMKNDDLKDTIASLKEDLQDCQDEVKELEAKLNSLQ